MQIYCAKIGVLAQAPGIPAAHSQREKDRWPICKKTEKSASRSRSPGAQTSSRGRNAVSEALRAGRTIDSLYIQRGERSGALSALVAKAKAAGAAIKEADPRKLDHLCGGANHQGVVAVAAVKEYATVEDLFQLAQERGEPPFFVLCDELEDPHNLGAIIRTAECAGAHGVIIPKRRNVGLTWAVGKASAGAVEHLPVARVGNPGLHPGGAESPGPVGVRRGHGRRPLVPDGLYRPGGLGHRLGGPGRQPPGERKGRFCRFPPFKRENQLAERLGGGGHPLLRGFPPAGRLKSGQSVKGGFSAYVTG